ncbi:MULTISPECIES: alpha/beta hydrolase [unclassified Bradyrhizobium]|uniref:alpha/beta fold hydrolase n=2 Tax=Bradyrhizobium TaxID=374 RepID=UPI0020120EBD|nr:MULTISPECIES: alpha/beta hydrolase [unclassified Bradyrhizobium]
MIAMIVLWVVIALLVLALITWVGVRVIERIYRPAGRLVDVAGGRLHVVELGPRDAAGPPLVLVHGASSNLESMRLPLGTPLARRHRVILVDRPGHGFSIRARADDSLPAIQAAMINEGLEKLGISSAIFVVHSLAGTLGPAMALNHPACVAGLVMLAPVTHPWRGSGVAWHDALAATPLIGPLFARTLALPAGVAVLAPGARSAFVPQAMPSHYVRDAALALLLRPLEFLANAHDRVTLKAGVLAQVGRYGDIAVPATVIAGDADTIVPIDVHARAFVAAVPHARLVELPGVGHMVQNAATDTVIAAIDAMVDALTPQRQFAEP